MNDRNETIIDTVIKKADALCPDSLALIGVYGSVATGDEYGKSDLDLMILINDENGQVLADGFIIDDVDIGYDLYCTSWDMLENDAQCGHAHLSRLFDSIIVYCKDKSVLKRLDEIRRKAPELLASDKRYEKADQAYSDAKKMLAEVYLAQSLSKARSCAGAAIEFIENAVMLYNGQYFRKGTKRALDELNISRQPLRSRSLRLVGQLPAVGPSADRRPSFRRHLAAPRLFGQLPEHQDKPYCHSHIHPCCCRRHQRRMAVRQSPERHIAPRTHDFRAFLTTYRNEKTLFHTGSVDDGCNDAVVPRTRGTAQ